MIPKTIHYCWFGGEVPAAVKMCIASWRKYCPDWQFRRWDESCAPIDIPFVKEALRHKRYAFAADYTRFHALYYEGGIYLDTDMLLIRPLDGFLDNNMFLGREDASNASMGIIGCQKGNELCRQCLDIYENTKFNVVSPPIITRLITPLLQRNGLTETDTCQTLDNNIVVYSSDYFYPIHYSASYNIDKVMEYATQNTYAIHLWSHSWKDELQMLAAGQYKEGFEAAWKHIRHTPILPARYWAKLAKYSLKYFRHLFHG